MIEIKQITCSGRLYELEKKLRNEILLRPLGIPDGAWEMHDRVAWHFVAVEHGKVMGCALLLPSEEHQNQAQLLQMAVAEGQQGKGLGKRLVHHTIEFAQTRGITKITCHSRRYANSFYQKFGFKVHGKTFEEVGLPHNHMSLKLGSNQI